MQEEGTLLSKYPLVQLAALPKGSGQESENKSTAATTTDDTVDSPHVSPTASGQSKDKTEDVNDEVIANTGSSITVDSNTVVEALVSLSFTLQPFLLL